MFAPGPDSKPFFTAQEMAEYEKGKIAKKERKQRNQIAALVLQGMWASGREVCDVRAALDSAEGLMIAIKERDGLDRVAFVVHAEDLLTLTQPIETLN